MNDVDYLIISSLLDYSTDLICYELHRQSKNYLRINRDCFHEYDIIYSLENETMWVTIGSDKYCIRHSRLKCVYFRAPVFLRSHKHYTIEEQLQRSQWNAFIRNLIVFDKAKWINHPVSTYYAENKVYQLKIAKEIGLLVPKTYVGNVLPREMKKANNCIIKSLDTALFYDGKEEYFTYTTKFNSDELNKVSIKQAPVFFQNYIDNKTDVRVTIIGKKIFAVSITNNGEKIDGDWRKNKKDNLNYSLITLPLCIKTKLLDLMSKLHLQFGGIDLAKVGNNYYFIEVNPTGEWGWLKFNTGLPLDKEIVQLMEEDVCFEKNAL